jgi:hypothetical protein
MTISLKHHLIESLDVISRKAKKADPNPCKLKDYRTLSFEKSVVYSESENYWLASLVQQEGMGR